MLAAAVPALHATAGLAQVRAEDKATAQVLFDGARQLLTEQRYSEACAKFQESQRLDPGLGTMLYLADCFERSGRTASAWATFLEAASLAAKTGEARRKEIAEVRARNLEGQLARITIVVPEPVRVAGLQITRNGATVWPATWGVAFPVDPGEHRFVVSAPGKESANMTLQVSAQGTATFTVPALEAAPAPPPAARTPQTATTVTPEQRTTPQVQRAHSPVAFVLGGAGVVGLGVGTFFGLRAISKNDASLEHCDKSGRLCDQDGVDLRETAQTSGTISTVGFIAGGALLASGVVIYFATGSGKSETALNRLYLAGGVGNGANLRLGGRW